MPLCSEEIHLFVHRGHPLAFREVVSLHDLRGETIIVGNRDDDTRDLIESRFRQEAFRPAHVMEMDHVSGMKQMLRSRLSGEVLAAAVGKVTAEALEEERVAPVLQPSDQRIGSLIVSLARYFQTGRLPQS